MPEAEPCPFFKRPEEFQCSTTKALPTVRPVVESILGEPVSMADVQGLLCKVGGGDCPVLSDLSVRGPRSMFARPVNY